ncbi:ATP-grasp domain-containing protein [Candidatus Dojkabacteria bacterium]|jgi:glutathione synthase/RimK-type ligase-like ATP-grasp enzyme|nr:ATP-grasp domain-containing protein [Candidatus Dojkabacteria bacterium]
MRYLIIDKKQRLEKYKDTYSKNRIIEELTKLNIEYTFAYNDEIDQKDGNPEIKVKGIDITSFTHIILRGHNLHNPSEYETKRIIAHYIDQYNAHNAERKILLQNIESLNMIEQYNKLYMYKMFTKMGIPSPVTIYRPDGIYSNTSLPYPFILKDFTGENDIRIINGEEKIKKNVYLIEKEEDLKQENLINKDLTKYIAQKFIPTGEDFRVFVSNGIAIGGFKRVATEGIMTVLKGKYTSISRETEKELFELAERVGKELKSNFIAVDLMIDERTPVVIEISLNPGFKAYETKTEGKVGNIAQILINSF